MGRLSHSNTLPVVGRSLLTSRPLYLVFHCYGHIPVTYEEGRARNGQYITRSAETTCRNHLREQLAGTNGRQSLHGLMRVVKAQLPQTVPHLINPALEALLSLLEFRVQGLGVRFNRVAPLILGCRPLQYHWANVALRLWNSIVKRLDMLCQSAFVADLGLAMLDATDC